MSLLSLKTFANPTTALFGGGGGGGGSNLVVDTLAVNQGGSITLGSAVTSNTILAFNKDVSGTTQSQLSMAYIPDNGGPADLHLLVTDQTGFASDTFAVGDLLAMGTGNPYTANAVCLGDAGTGTLGLRLVDNSVGGVLSTYATFASNAVDLSNVTSINGSPYISPAVGTTFSYSNYPGGALMVEAPDWGVLNAQSFTAPANGRLYMESLGTFVALENGGTAVMNFAINGVDAPVEATKCQSIVSNVNFFGTSMYSIPVTGGQVYDISSIAQCSAIPPSPADVAVTSSRMFLMFNTT